MVNLLAPVREQGSSAPGVYQLLAQAYLALQNFPSARAASQKFVDLAPESAEALVLLALSEMGLERFADAEASLRAASTLSDSPQIRGQLISMLIRSGKFDAARKELNDIPAGFLPGGQYEFGLGQIAEAEGDLSGAAAAFARSLEKEQNTRALLARNRVLWRMGEQADAMGELRSWLVEHPEETEVLGRLANLHLLLGEDAAAAVPLEQLNKLMPNNLSVLNNLAWASRNTDPRRSLTWARQAAQLAPDNPGIRDTLAMVLLANGEADAALDIIDELQKNIPDQPGLALHRAEILAALGRDNEAREILDALIAEGKSVEKAREIRGTLSR
jgi:Flp pilus assembly protein TadD